MPRSHGAELFNPFTVVRDCIASRAHVHEAGGSTIQSARRFVINGVEDETQALAASNLLLAAYLMHYGSQIPPDTDLHFEPEFNPGSHQVILDLPTDKNTASMITRALDTMEKKLNSALLTPGPRNKKFRFIEVDNTAASSMMAQSLLMFAITLGYDKNPERAIGSQPGKKEGSAELLIKQDIWEFIQKGMGRGL